MKTVLHVITDVNIAGAGILLLNLLAERANYETEVAVPVGSRLIPRITALGVTCWEVPHIEAKSVSIRGIPALTRLIGKRKPDIVHTHAAFSGRVAAKLCGVPIVHTRHSIFDPRPRDDCFPRRQVQGFVNHFLADAVIAVSPPVRDDLIRTGTRADHITVIFNGTPDTPLRTMEERSAIRKRYGIKPNAFVISQAARLTDVKGQDYTLDAAKILADDPDIVFLIAGDGPLEAHLRGRVQNEMLENVIMPGFVDTVADVTNITDLHLNASYGTETCSLAMLEAMCLGIPSVVSDFGGNPYVITDHVNGYIVPRKNGAALADGIRKIKNDPRLYEKFSINAKAEYENRFRSKRMAEEVESVYSKCLEERK